MNEPPLIQIQLFGTPHLEVGTQPVRIERRKAFGLLAYIAVNAGQAHSREALATLFWPDQERSQAFAYLRNALWTISKAVGSAWMLTEGETVQFNRNAGLVIDVNRFMELAESNSLSDLLEAAALYQGEFMAGFTLDGSAEYDDWQYLQSAELRCIAGDVLDRLVHKLTTNKNLEEAVTFASRRVALDPLDEAAQRQLIQTYALAGQRNAALRQFEEFAHLLRVELDATPEPETVRLLETIRTQSVARPVERSTTHRDNLPRHATPLIGRADDLRAILTLFLDPTCRLVTLVGQGGIGKTRLAIEAGRVWLEAQAPQISEACYIGLASVCSPDLLISTLITALDFKPEANQNQREQLFNYLRERSTLLVIDNFEHLLEGGELLAEILSQAPQIRFLVTSRERLNLQEEYLYEVRGLTHPFHPTDDGNFGSVEMFYQCARRIGYQPLPADLPAIHQICHMVEGLPLGIELAAGWLQALTPAQIVLEIQHGLDILSTTARNIPERHRSVRAVFETSCERLSPDEQHVLRSVSIFRGGFTLEAAHAVAGATPRLLLSLTHKSLLRRNNTRYEIHELLRQYALEQLDPPARRAALDGHSRYFSEYLALRLPALRGRQQRRALDEIEAELDNIRSMWLYAAETHKVKEMAQAFDAWSEYSKVRLDIRETRDLMERLAENLCDEATPDECLLLGRVLAVLAFSMINSNPREEWLPIYQRALTLLRQFPDSLEATHSKLLIALLTAQPGYPTTEPAAIVDEILPVVRQHRDRFGEAWALLLLGQIAHLNIKYPEANEYFVQALRVYEEMGYAWGIGAVYGLMGDQDHTLGEFQMMRDHSRRASEYLESIGDRNLLPTTIDDMLLESKPLLDHSIDALTVELEKAMAEGKRANAAWIRYSIAGIHLMREEYEAAAPLFAQSLAEFRQLQFNDGICWSLIFTAQLALVQGRLADAERLLDEALETIREMTFPWGVSGAAYVRGDLELVRGNVAAAQRLYADAVKIAYDACSVLQVLRHTNGLAEIHLRGGDYPSAARIAAYTEQHPATWRDVVRRSGTILDECEKYLGAERIAAVREEATKLDYDLLIGGLISEPA